jgi:hypothetical protein
VLLAKLRRSNSKESVPLNYDQDTNAHGMNLTCIGLISPSRLVARLHEVGFEHADLQPANLLIVGDPAEELPQVVALDLDRSRFLPGLDAAARHKNLARLWRHVRRREELYGAAVSRADRARFLRAWATNTRRGGKPAVARQLWRAAWRAIEAEERRGRGLHQLGWALGRVFGGAADPRAARGSARREA